MHVPKDFAQDSWEAISEAVRASRVGDLVTLGSGGLEATPVPLLLEDGDPNGTLVGHLSRANPQWRSAEARREALVLFRPVDAYISPSFYPSKVADGRVVPTWNYVSVQIWGPLIVHDDSDWVGSLVRRLTDHHESSRARPWSVDDAPPDYVSKNLRAIVGIEIPISRFQAKWKLSQNRPPADAEGAANGLDGGSDRDRQTAAYMRKTNDLIDDQSPKGR